MSSHFAWLSTKHLRRINHRSMAAFVGWCDGGSTDDGCAAASMDETTIKSLHTVMHHNFFSLLGRFFCNQLPCRSISSYTSTIMTLEKPSRPSSRSSIRRAWIRDGLMRMQWVSESKMEDFILFVGCYSIRMKFFSLKKKFVRGLKQHGKNFFKIRKELLPYKDTVWIHLLCCFFLTFLHVPLFCLSLAIFHVPYASM